MKKIVLAAAVLLGCCGMAKAPEKEITVYLIGDSTCAAKSESARPETGWGEKLGQHFKKGVKVDNRALNGRSTKSFRDQGHWDKILGTLRPGDFVFIQFGHNDQKESDPKRYSDPETFGSNLKRYIEETRAKGAVPVLLTSIARRKFDAKGKPAQTLRRYTSVTRRVAEQTGTPLIDMDVKTRALLEEMGPEASKSIYLWAKKSDYPNLKEDKRDDTHLNAAGAEKYAQIVADGIRELKLEPLARKLRKIK